MANLYWMGSGGFILDWIAEVDRRGSDKTV